MGKARPMDALKAALAERQAKAQKIIDETGQKWIKRSEIELKRQEEYHENKRLEEEKEKASEEMKMQKFKDSLAKAENTVGEAIAETAPHLIDESLLDDDDAEPPIGVEEVIESLREINQPITLFGETDMMRYKRLRKCQRDGETGRVNPDILALEQVSSGQRQSIRDKEEEEEDKEEEEQQEQEEQAPEPVADDKSDSEDDSEDVGKKQRQEPGDVAEKQAPDLDDAPIEVENELMDKCDFIRKWCRMTLKTWEKELADKPEEDKKKAVVKTEIAAHRQVRRDIRPLQKRLKVYALENEMLQKIHPIIKYAADKEYLLADEAYLDLSIGKAAWPVGIGCGGSMLMEDAIGLHDRFNRMENVKDIAYLLNNEVNRKYVQALKRLLNCAKRYWPNDKIAKS